MSPQRSPASGFAAGRRAKAIQFLTAADEITTGASPAKSASKPVAAPTPSSMPSARSPSAEGPAGDHGEMVVIGA